MTTVTAQREMGKRKGSYSSSKDKEKKDSGSLTVKVLIVCVIVLVAIDGLNRQSELVVHSPETINLPQHRAGDFLSTRDKTPKPVLKKKKKKLVPVVAVEDTTLDALVETTSFEVEGVLEDLGETSTEQEFSKSVEEAAEGVLAAAPAPPRMKVKKSKPPKPPIDIGSIRPRCGSSRCRARAAAIRQKLRKERREAADLALFPIKKVCDVDAVREFIESGPANVVMSGESWKAGGRLKMPKVIPPPGETKSNITEWLMKCPTFKALYVGTVNSKLVDSGIVPEVDPLKYHIRNKHDSCAIIGNGGGLLLAPLGEQIDKHEAIFRFNGGPTFGFEKYVGKRTTYRLDNSQHFLFHEPGTNEIILQHITNREMFNQVKEEAEIIVGAESTDLRVHIIDPMFHYFVMNVNRIGAPSNGFFGIVLSSLICNQITLFGYQKDWRNQSIPYHYYDEVEPILGQWDRDNREKHQLENTIELINSMARDDPEWKNWKQHSGWSYDKVVYAEGRYTSFFTKEIPEQFKVYHTVEPGSTLPPLDENGNPVLPPDPSEEISEPPSPPEELFVQMDVGSEQ